MRVRTQQPSKEQWSNNTIYQRQRNWCHQYDWRSPDRTLGCTQGPCLRFEAQVSPEAARNKDASEALHGYPVRRRRWRTT